MTRLSLVLYTLVSVGGSLAVDCTYDAVLPIMPVAANGTFIVPEGDLGWPMNPINLPKLCAIGATVPDESNSNYTFGFGLFLPDTWNGRTL